MSKGNCYEANFKELCLVNPMSYGEEWVLVHAMREIIQGTEWWGGHAFLLNTDTDEVHDFSNGKHEVYDKDDIYAKWSIQVMGNQTYYEYTKKQAGRLAVDTGHYGCWELKFEMWNTEGWNEYMKDYWVPTHEPRRDKLQKMSDEGLI